MSPPGTVDFPAGVSLSALVTSCTSSTQATTNGGRPGRFFPTGTKTLLASSPASAEWRGENVPGLSLSNSKGRAVTVMERAR
uniref:Putative secreted protein n=1 Tax=Ixodes ricinus TaxID=34613 RepID=A0A6B0TYQ0_IXORI